MAVVRLPETFNSRNGIMLSNIEQCVMDSAARHTSTGMRAKVLLSNDNKLYLSFIDHEWNFKLGSPRSASEVINFSFFCTTDWFAPQAWSCWIVRENTHRVILS